MKGQNVAKYCMLLVVIYVIFIYISCEKKQPTGANEAPAIPDSTSHDFEWQFNYFGDGASSYFRDVCIIDENDIWAVGAVYLKDSEGNYEDTYNTIHWDGTEWNLNRIQFPVSGSKSTAPFPAKSVFSSKSNQVLFTSAGTICIKNGDSLSKMCIPSEILTGSINKIWGSSASNFFIVGNLGTIIHYDGSTWQKLESGTNQPINDIWGIYDSKNNQSKIFCVASDKYHSGEMKVFQILQGQIVQEFDWSPQRRAQSVWFGDNTPLYICGSGLHINENGKWKQVTELPKIYKNRVRGNHQNDLFVVGDFGLFAHYNGISWKVYDSLKFSSGQYNGLDVRGDLVVAVGETGNRAAICIGRRRK